MAGSFGVGTGTNAAATTTPAGPNAGLDSSSSDKVTVSNISNTTINSTTGTSTSPVSEDTKTITSTAVAMDASVVSAVAASDWTYSSDYVCTLHTLNSTGTICAHGILYITHMQCAIRHTHHGSSVIRANAAVLHRCSAACQTTSNLGRGAGDRVIQC